MSIENHIQGPIVKVRKVIQWRTNNRRYYAHTATDSYPITAGEYQELIHKPGILRTLERM